MTEQQQCGRLKRHPVELLESSEGLVRTVSQRRQERRTSERRARAVKARQAAVAPKGKVGRLSQLGPDWIFGGILASVVLIIAATFAFAYYFSNRGSGNPIFAQVFSVAVSPSEPNRMLLGDASGLYISSDSGKKWSAHVINSPVRKVYYDPNNTKVFYAVGGSSIQKSTDGATTWNTLGANLPSGGITALASDPADSSKMYAFVNGSGLYRSEDSGAKWSQVQEIRTASLSSLAVKAGSPDTVYAFHNTDGFVLSTNNGRKFDPAGDTVLPKKAVSDIMTFAQEPSTIYAAADLGVYKSTDGGSTWVRQEAGLRGINVVALSRDSVTGKLYASDWQGAVYASSDSGAGWAKTNS